MHNHFCGSNRNCLGVINAYVTADDLVILLTTVRSVYHLVLSQHKLQTVSEVGSVEGCLKEV